jgi:hypothetical protein
MMAKMKLDHIPLLEGTINYTEWARAMKRVLQAEGLWAHAAGVRDDPLSPWAASYAPQITANSNATAMKTFREWWHNDAKAQDVIERRLSPIIMNLLPHDDNVTLCTTWEFLEHTYDKVDIATQHMLHNCVTLLCLKDSSDVDRYLGEYNKACQCFRAMGATYSEHDAMHQIISGLPCTGSWENFKQLLLEIVETMTERSAENAQLGNPVTLNETYMKITQHIISECTRLEFSKPLPGPGSEYAQVKKHANNLNGLECTNPKCPPSSRKTHDLDHCWSPGGGAEHQRLRKTRPTEMAAMAITHFEGDYSC